MKLAKSLDAILVDKWGADSAWQKMVEYLLKISWWWSRKNILVERNSVQDAVMQAFENYGNNTDKESQVDAP